MHKRAVQYITLGLVLAIGLPVLGNAAWQSATQFHTVMETVSTLLAFLAGILALVRYYTKKEILFLMIGAGFLGTGVLDGYHAIVTSDYFRPYSPADLPSLIPWSWVASRLFLSLVMALSFVAWLRRETDQTELNINERSIYAWVLFSTLASIAFFSFAPLPEATYPELFFHRPEEFAPALIFFIALVGFIRKGEWRTNSFHHWLVLSLIVGLIGQAVLMSVSGQLFDYEFDVAHVLKIVSYICVLTGLLINTYEIFGREVTAMEDLAISNARFGQAQKRLSDAIANINEGFCLFDKDDRLVLHNEPYLELFNAIRDKVHPGVKFRTLIEEMIDAGEYPAADGNREEFIESLLAIHRGGAEAREWQLGEDRWILLNDRRTPDGEYVTLRTDISELKAREKELAEKEELFSIAFHASPAMMAISKPEDGFHIDVNKTWSEITGYSREEALERSALDLGVWAHPEQREEFIDQIRRKGSAINMEAIYRTKNGAEVEMMVSGEFVEIAGKQRLLIVGHDITEQKELDRLKSEFISTVSHELRTPLTSIKGSIGIVASGVTGDLSDEAKSLIDIANKNSERLVNLINDILDIEKIEAGKLDLQLRSLDFRSTIDKSISSLQGYADQYDVAIKIASEINHEVTVEGDEDRLIQVLSNLISNAIKFSPTGGVVTVGLTVETGWMRASVSDDGPGVDVDFQAKLFQKFAQADSSDTRQKGGTGLGLSISKAIVEHHRGTIGFDSKPDEGATFHFDLPLLDVEEIADIFDAPGHQSKKILICEDDHDIARLLKLMLARDGYESDIAYSAAEARTMLQENSYDALTLDLVLPDDTGGQFLQEIKETPESAGMPIVVVSVIADQTRQALNGDALGVVDWLTKPLDEERLKSAMHRAVSKSPNRPCILHIEDDEDVFKITSIICRDLADVIHANNFQDSLVKLKQRRYDAVILDIGLPDGNGYDLITEIRKVPGDPMPVLIYSADQMSVEVAEQVDAALVKSNTTNGILRNTINALINPDRA